MRRIVIGVSTVGRRPATRVFYGREPSGPYVTLDAMNSSHQRRTAACFVTLVVIASSAACSSSTSDAPSPAPSVPHTPGPTEKSINPTGGNLFTPPVKAPPPQAPAPGNLPGNMPKN
jgi:hypothetical protein